MSAKNGSASRAKKHLVVGTSSLAVGTLSIGEVTRLCRIWTAAELSGKKEAGIPSGYGYVHIVSGTPGALVNVLRAATKAAGATFYEPEPEDLVEDRLRPFLGLPPLKRPQVSCVHSPTQHFKDLAAAAIARQSVAEATRDAAETQALEAMQGRDELAGRLGTLAARDGRLCALVTRLRQKLGNTRIAFATATRPQPMQPEEFQAEWREMCVALSEAQAEAGELRERLAKIGSSARARGVRASTVTKMKSRVTELEAQVKELEELATERAKRIRSLQAQLARADKQFEEVSDNLIATLKELEELKTGKTKKKR